MRSPPNALNESSRRSPAVARRKTLAALLATLAVACFLTAPTAVRAQDATGKPGQKIGPDKPANASWLNVARAQPDAFKIPGQSPVQEPGESAQAPEGEEGIEPSVGYWDRMGPPRSADCCKGCPSFWYGQFDAFFANRNDSDRTQIAASLDLGSFDWQTGTRITVGRQADCLEALEFVYTGVNNWENSAAVSSAAPTLQSLFNQGVGIFNLDDFDNAIFQSAVYESNLNSFEFNRRRWGWDIVSTVFGFRYINLEESLVFTSLPGVAPLGTFGRYDVRSNNNLLGVQIGGDMLYPIGPGMNLAGRGKLGLFGNGASQTTRVSNNSAVVIRNSNEELNYSVLLELGGYMTYRVRPRCTLKVGYEMWYIWNVALATEQMTFNAGPSMGSLINSDGTLFLTAFTAGAEFQW